MHPFYKPSALLAAAIMLAPGIAVATSARATEANSSAYSSTADKDCRKLSVTRIDDDDYASSHLCKGIAGIKVLKQEDDMRETVSVGRSASAAAGEPAAGQGFGPFNSTTGTVEWRLGAGGRPFAMIQRWHIADIDDPDKQGRPNTKQMLVVTRLPPGTACHVAYVDVKANPNANARARQAADESARKFDCSRDKVSIAGAGGRATALAIRK